MNRQEIKENESVKYWLETIASPRARQNYMQDFPKFIEFVGKSPDEIIRERRQQLTSQDPKERRHYEHVVIAFQNKLYEQGLAPYSVTSSIRTVMSFFSHNDVPLNFHRKELKQARPKKSQKHIVTNEEVRAIYSFADVTERTLLLTMYHTGMSPADVCSLNVEDYDFYHGQAPLYFEHYREKSEMLTGTCFSEECLYDIRLMLQARENPHKGPLFVTQKGNRFEPRFVREALLRVAKKAQIKFQPKDLRDAYHDALQRANINAQVIDRMMGHSLGGARDNYKISPYTVVEAYTKAFEYLSIDHARREREEEALKARVASLEKFIKEATLVSQEEMKRRIEHLERELSERDAFIKTTLTNLAKTLHEKGIDLKDFLKEESA